MTEYAQFAHLNHAALKPANNLRGRDKKWTAKQILAEAARVPGNYAHVVNPQKPRWIVGSRAAVQQRQATWRDQAREASGKAHLRATSPSLACAVFSWPRGREPEWNAYRDDVIAYQLKKFGPKRMVGVVEHLDEAHQHIHVYLVPFDDEPFGTVHPGIAAGIRARALKGNHARIAYIDAMVKWQDELWRETGRPHGLLRFGEQRARLSRVKFTEQAKTSKAVADAKIADEKAAGDAKAAEERAIIRRKNLAAKERIFQTRAAALADAAKHLKTLEERFAEASAGTVTKKLAASELALVAANKRNLVLETQLADAQYRNAEHEKLAQAAGRRLSEGVPVEIRQRTPKP